MKIISKNLIIAIIAVIGIAFVSCEKEMDTLTPELGVDNELKSAQVVNDKGLIQTRSSDCSYPYGGENLTGFIHGQQELSHGKYYHRVKINDAAIPQEKNFSFRVISGGPVITRSVKGSNIICFLTRFIQGIGFTTTKPITRYFNAYNTADDDYDYIDYEIITEVNADISWNERNGLYFNGFLKIGRVIFTLLFFIFLLSFG